MKLIINSDLCAKQQLNIEESLILYLISRGCNLTNIIAELVNRGLANKQDDCFVLPSSTKKILDEILLGSGNINETRLNNLATKMQKCFPEGKPQGSITYYMANKREIIFKLQRFFAQYGDYSDDDIVDVTKKYVESYHGNYKYLPVITNFIIKTVKSFDEFGNPVVEEISQLATQLENKEAEESVHVNDDSWLFSSRN